MIGAYNRDISIRKAKRKRRIDIQHKTSYNDGKPVPWYNNLHQYSKNKIHCSCPDCNTKTRNKGSKRHRSGNYNQAILYRASDLRKVVAMDEDLREAGYFAPKHKRNRYA